MNPNQWLFYVILPLTIAVVGYASSKLFELVLTRRQQREQMVREHSGHDTAIAQARRAMNLPDEDTSAPWKPSETRSIKDRTKNLAERSGAFPRLCTALGL